MKITVAVSGSTTDAVLMAWCAQHARPGDALHVVHTYVKRSGARYGLVNAARANTDRAYRARQVLDDAYDELNPQLDRDTMSVDTAAVVGALPDVLADESERADLIVIGAAEAVDALPARKIGCPVAIVPRGWTADAAPARDIAVLCGREIPATAIDLAVEHARRTHMSVLVLEGLDAETEWGSGDGPHAGDTAQAERLAMQIASWEAPDGPPIVAEIRSGCAAAQLRAAAGTIGILVVPSAGDDGADAVRVALFELGIPVLVAPAAR